MKNTSLVFAALIAAASTVLASDWPQFRGPDANGHVGAMDLPVKWSASKNVAWKKSLPGVGWSSPSIVNGRIYLTSAVETSAGSKGNPPSAELRVLCLDSKTGKMVWNKEVFSHTPDRVAKKHDKNSFASPTPLIVDGRIYVHFGHMGTACLDLDGKVIWRNDSLPYSPVHGNGGSPALVGDVLFFSCDAAKAPFVVALNKDTGKLMWKRNRNVEVKRTFSFSTPAVINVNGQTQIISPGSGAVMAYEPKTGKEIWRAYYGEGYSVVPRPVYGNGLLYVCTGFNKANLLAIDPTGKGDVTETHIKWTVSRSVPKTPSVLLIGEEIFMVSDNGIASCVNAKTGEIHYEERLGGGVSASPIYANGRIYVQNEKGVGYVVAAGKEFKVLSENDLGERTLASYAAADGALFIRTEGSLFRIGSKL